MASVTLSITDQFKEQLKHFQWVNWSEIAKEEIDCPPPQSPAGNASPYSVLATYS